MFQTAVFPAALSAIPLPLLVGLPAGLIGLSAVFACRHRRRRHTGQRQMQIYLFDENPKTVVRAAIRKSIPQAGQLQLELETPEGDRLFFATVFPDGAAPDVVQALTVGTVGLLSYCSGQSALFTPVKSRPSAGIPLVQTERGIPADTVSFLFHP